MQGSPHFTQEASGSKGPGNGAGAARRSFLGLLARGMLAAAAGVMVIGAPGRPAAQDGPGVPAEVRQAMHEERETLAVRLSPEVVRVYAFDYELRTASRLSPVRARYLELAGTGCLPDPENASYTPLYGLFNWRSLPVTYRIDTLEAPSYLDPEDVRAAIRASFEAWDAEEIPAGQLFSEAADNVPADVVVRWTDMGAPFVSGFASLNIDFTTQEIVSAEILLNSEAGHPVDGFVTRWGILPPDCGWNPPPGFPNFDFVRDVQNVATHEVGHVLNLGHSYSLEKDIGQTMFWSTITHLAVKQTPGHGDRNGLRALYLQPGR